MKKNITYVAAETVARLIAESGLPTQEKSGWTLVGAHATKGPRLYVPKTKKVGRIDLVGVGSDMATGVADLGEAKFGAVTHQVDFGRDEAAILLTLEDLLGQLKASQAFAPKERPAKEAKAPRARQAKGTEAPVEAAAPQSRKDRLALIRATAQQHGVAVSADVEQEAVEAEIERAELTGESPTRFGHNASDSQ